MEEAHLPVCSWVCSWVCVFPGVLLLYSQAFKAAPEAALTSHLPCSILPLLSDQSRPAQTTNPACLSEPSGPLGTLGVLLAWFFSWEKACFLKLVLVAGVPWPMVKMHSNQIGRTNFKCFSLDTPTVYRNVPAVGTYGAVCPWLSSLSLRWRQE